MQRRVNTPFGEIEYTFTPKAVKNINIRILRTGVVNVSAPRRADPRLADDFVIKKAEQIIRAKKRLAARAPEDDAILLFGKPLTILYKNGKKDAFLEGDTLTLTLPDPSDTSRAAAALDLYLREQLLFAVDRICGAYFPYFEALGYPYPVIKLRKMTSRYGTCHTKKHIITISTTLVRSPLCLLEFVVLHELVHFIHPNHSPAFYNELSVLMPDWKARRAALR